MVKHATPQVPQEELVELASLKEHPRNYRIHGEEQLDHLMASIRDHGIYRSIVIAQDNTILAGHGVVKAARRLGLTHGPARRLPLAPDHPLALKVLAGDNEIAHLAEVDPEVLAGVLLEVQREAPEGLLGTGFDGMMLAALRSRLEAEAPDMGELWQGMPDFEQPEQPSWKQLIVHFANQADYEVFAQLIGQPLTQKSIWIWYPKRERADLASLAYVGEEAPGAA